MEPEPQELSAVEGVLARAQPTDELAIRHRTLPHSGLIHPHAPELCAGDLDVKISSN